MFNLPNTPVNTAITFGTLGVLGLIAYTQKLRTSLDSQNLQNYRHAKEIDAGIKPETPVSLTDRSSRTA